jgi:hypothetical protein
VRAPHSGAGSARPAPTTSHTGEPAWRATAAAAWDPGTARKASGPEATASRSTRSLARTAAAVAASATSVASTSSRPRRRTSWLPSPRASTTRATTSPLGGRARAATSGQPSTVTVASSGRSWTT